MAAYTTIFRCTRSSSCARERDDGGYTKEAKRLTCWRASEVSQVMVAIGLRVWGLRCNGFRVQGLRCNGFRVLGLKFRVCGGMVVGFRV